MKNKPLSKRIHRYFHIRWLAFKRKPFMMLRYVFMIMFFRLLGILFCIFLTVIPLPLNHLLQNFFNLNLSFNSFKDILTSVKKIALNFNHLLPTPTDIFNMLKQLFINVTSINPLNIIRELPNDLRQFFVQFFSRLQERLRDLKLFLKKLWPLSQCWRRIKFFVKTHTRTVKRIIRSLLMMVSSLCLVKILFILIIPYLGIKAIHILGIDITLIIIGILSLISSQLGSLLGKGITTILIRFYDHLQKKRPQYKYNIFIVIPLLLYAKLCEGILFIRRLILRGIAKYLTCIESIKLTIFMIYTHSKK